MNMEQRKEVGINDSMIHVDFMISASGVTAKLAERLADAIGADLSEIVPKVRYTSTDLDWRNKQSRSSVEMNDRSCRPEINRTVDDMAQ